MSERIAAVLTILVCGVFIGWAAACIVFGGTP